jgi:YD repeat-containing protein
MPRGASTQTRTWNYDQTTQRLTSNTNPENGTVSYTYNADGTVATRKMVVRRSCLSFTQAP